MARRNKPHDPAAAARAAEERRAQEAEKARLIAQGVEVTLDHVGRIVSARRSNVFNLLLHRGAITQNHYNAAYDLANDWAAMKGLDGKPETFGAFVDGGSPCVELVTDRMLKAGERVARTFAMLGSPESVKLLAAFMVATVEEDRPMAWRGIVDRTFGPTARDRQTKAVFDALEDLRQVYETPQRAAA